MYVCPAKSVGTYCTDIYAICVVCNCSANTPVSGAHALSVLDILCYNKLCQLIHIRNASCCPSISVYIFYSINYWAGGEMTTTKHGAWLDCNANNNGTAMRVQTRICTIFLSIYTVMARVLGIVPQILNLDAIKQQPQQTFIVDNEDDSANRNISNVNGNGNGPASSNSYNAATDKAPPQDPHPRRCNRQKQQRQCLKRWHALSITICIAFACGYPYSISKLLQNPTNGKKGVNYFITYIYYGAKYIVTLIIYFVQFRNDQQFQYIQRLSQTMYGQLCRFNLMQQKQCPPFLVGYRFEPRDQMSINAWNVGNFCKTIAMMVGYLYVNYLKLTHIFHNPSAMTIFDLFCYYYPNVFICLYVTQFYIGIQQQVYIFNEINTVFSEFIEELNYFGVRTNAAQKNTSPIVHVLARNNANGNAVVDVEKENHANDRIGRIMYLPVAIDKLNELIFIHETLRYVNTRLERMHSMQIVFIIVNAFMNIVSEVNANCH